MNIIYRLNYLKKIEEDIKDLEYHIDQQEINVEVRNCYKAFNYMYNRLPGYKNLSFEKKHETIIHDIWDVIEAHTSFHIEDYWRKHE